MKPASRRGFAAMLVAALVAALGLVGASPAVAANGSIQGTLYGNSGPLSGATVYLETVTGTHSWEAVASAETAPNGLYVFPSVAPGKYRVYTALGAFDHYSGWFAPTATDIPLTQVAALAKIITVGSGQAVYNINGQSVFAKSIEGILSQNAGVNQLDGLVGVEVLFNSTAGWVEMTEALPSVTLNYYKIDGLAPGEYKVLFIDGSGDSVYYVSEWYNSASTEASATIIAVDGQELNFNVDLVKDAAPSTMTPTAVSITGPLQAGKGQVASHSAWNPPATDYSYRWYLNGDPVPGQSSFTLPANTAKAGDWAFVRVAGEAAGYKRTVVYSSEVGPFAPRFNDVPADHGFNTEIEWAAIYGITTGFPDGGFHPGDPVERRAMAAFLFRLAGNPGYVAPGTASFSDVPVGSLFFREIEWLKSEGITNGFPDGTFHPLDSVTRQDMAAFLYRTAGSPAYSPPGTASFSDVPVGAIFRKEIEWIKANGITNGYPDNTYHPVELVSRQAMAAFIYRLAGQLGQG